MLEKDIVNFLRSPYPQLIELALSMANLQECEEEVINSCIRKGRTQAKTAQIMGISEGKVQKVYVSTIKKLGIAFDGMNWIKKLID